MGRSEGVRLPISHSRPTTGGVTPRKFCVDGSLENHSKTRPKRSDRRFAEILRSIGEMGNLTPFWLPFPNVRTKVAIR